MTAPVCTRVVRTLGSNRIHVVDIHIDQLTQCTWIGDFLGIELPAVTRCGAMLRCSRGYAVCMRPGTKVSCPRCRRITGLAEAPADNATTVTA